MSPGRDRLEELEREFSSIWIEDAAYPAVMPGTTEDVIRAVDWCRENRWRILSVGRGHSFSARFALPGDVLTLISSSRDRLTAPDAHDLSIEAEAGVPAMALSGHVRKAGFRLDGWPEDYPGTVGGLICGRKGGTVRHLIMGMDIIDGRGKHLRFGGRVRKNVSGFDVPGLMAGSRGRLAWMERVYLRLSPLHAPSVWETPFRARTSVSEPTGIYARVSGAFDPEGVFYQNIS